MPETPRISVVVTIRDREDAVGALYHAIGSVLEARGESFEIIFVDDGSSDETSARLHVLAKEDPHLRVLELDGSFGDAAALSAGLQHSSGDAVVTIAGNGCDDIVHIPRILNELQRNGIRLVAGRRDASYEGFGIAASLSRLVDALAVHATRLPIHDPGCGLRAYRRSVLRPIQLPPGADYFLPALLGVDASEVGEIAVADRSRRPSRGIARSLANLSDLLGIRAIIADPRRAEIGFALFTAGTAALGAIVMPTSPILIAACDAIAVLSGVIWWSARRFNRAQRDGVYRLRDLGEDRKPLGRAPKPTRIDKPSTLP